MMFQCETFQTENPHLIWSTLFRIAPRKSLDSSLRGGDSPALEPFTIGVQGATDEDEDI